MLDLWYKNAVVYSLDVDTFADGNGDGIGDFRGLQDRLDYLAGLGVTCLWLLPFFPSPGRDNGYDVTDYFGVDPRLGTLGDFVEFSRQARERGLRLVIDLVVNHTSDQHCWFQAARADPRSRYRNYYIWADERPENAEHGVVFPGVQEATWSRDEAAGAWYHHRFYKHQPDLNIANPEVREEICRVMGFWLELGVSGFRLDAAPFLIDQVGAETPLGDPFELLRELRDFLSWRRGDAIMLAEANVTPEDAVRYFGDSGGMHLLFNFHANQRLFLGLARGCAEPLAKAMCALPRLPRFGQWANFLRNHDELDLGRLSDAERAEAFAAFAPEEGMRIYDRGIRRRLAPMLGGDLRKLELAYSLMFGLPGTPVLWYGEEIGMGERLDLPERNAVRTPMQWSNERNAGFSTADPSELLRPVAEGAYGPDCVSVAEQSRAERSLLRRVQRFIEVRRGCPELGWSGFQFIDAGDARVLAHRAEWAGRATILAHNLSGEACRVTVPLERGERRLRDLFSDGAPMQLDGAELRLDLEPYGYRWLRTVAQA